MQALHSGKFANCNTWLTGAAPFSASVYIALLIQDNTYAHGSFNTNTTAAFVGTRNSDGTIIPGLIGVPSITVNNEGAFFKQKSGDLAFTVGPKNYQGGTLKAQASILIHELGHLMKESGGAAGFQPDAGKKQEGRSNDNLVNNSCGKLIGGLR